ncbi:hypothetical protein LSUB1_G000383 [Lachnellula subtilissima]|uniref:Fungal N-terminal domain-containing protein n=1 Tax=Lachnellula subtilissima TaxID=602034 RepID=A0A8H8S594_9HELO|nr:hypothetical protein LSUB1_G000383 [Lachnellula subtilissima]
MAEALGVVASGIAVTQLATQVASSVIKLKNCWEQIKNVPTEISYLLREVDSLKLILCHIQDDQASQWEPNSVGNGVHLRQSLELCKQGSAELETLVNELGAKIEGKHGLKKKLGSAKVVLKNEEIKVMKRRLKSTIRLLSLSYQCHTIAMIQMQSEVIVTRVSNHIASATLKPRGSDDTAIETPTLKDVSQTHMIDFKPYEYWTGSPSWIHYIAGKFEYRKSYRKHRGKEEDKHYARYMLPRWFSDKAWEYRAHNTNFGWRIDLQTCRYLSINSPLFKAIRNRDLVSVRKMLLTREAFVTDRIENSTYHFRGGLWDGVVHFVGGHTALHFATILGDLEMSQLLLSEGADPLALDDRNKTPLHFLTRFASSLTFEKNVEVMELFRLLLRSGASELLIEDTSVLEKINAPISLVRCIQQEMYPSFSDLSLRKRIDLLVCAYGNWHHIPALLRSSFVNGSSISSEVLNWVNSRQESFLHLFAETLAENVCFPLRGVEIKFDETLHPEVIKQLRVSQDHSFVWRGIIKDFVSAGAPLHGINAMDKTPFWVLLDTSRAWIPTNNSSVVASWLTDMLTCGVDLQAYGAEEHAILMRNELHDVPIYCHLVGYYLPHRLINLTYGPHPDDWVFWYSEVTDQYAGTFWEMIEAESDASQDSLQMPMPGSWNDDDDT